MRIPKITNLQFLTLSILIEGACSGRDLRERLAQYKHRKTAPAFYQFMSRLEEARLVKGRYEQKLVAGQAVKERLYEITGSGVSAFDEYRDFAITRGAVRIQGA